LDSTEELNDNFGGERASQLIKELITKKNKNEYRIQHLLKYVTELEKENNDLKVKLQKADYRINHLKKYIDELEATPKEPQQHGYSSDRSSDIKPSSSQRLIKFHWGHVGSKVLVAGNFTRWDLVDISQTFELPPGTYYYKFNVDGRWCYDILKPHCDDGCSGFNNILEIF